MTVVHPIIVHKFLGKIIHHAFDATANTFSATTFTRSKFTSNLVSFTFGT